MIALTSRHCTKIRILTHEITTLVFLPVQLQPRYELHMEEPYDRAVACHLVRRAARDDGLKVTVTSRMYPITDTNILCL